jgi:hypothetical protein
MFYYGLACCAIALATLLLPFLSMIRSDCAAISRQLQCLAHRNLLTLFGFRR